MRLTVGMWQFGELHGPFLSLCRDLLHLHFVRAMLGFQPVQRQFLSLRRLELSLHRRQRMHERKLLHAATLRMPVAGQRLRLRDQQRLFGRLLYPTLRVRLCLERPPLWLFPRWTMRR